MLLKGHLGLSNVTPNISRSSDSLSTVPPVVNVGELAMHCAWPGYYLSLSHTCIQFYPPKVTPLTNVAKVTVQEVCYCNFNAWGWNNSHQNEVSDITNLIASERRINKLPGLIEVKMNWQQISLANQLTNQSLPSPTSGAGTKSSR